MVSRTVQLETFQPGSLTVPVHVPPNASRPVGVTLGDGLGADGLDADGAGWPAARLVRPSRAVADVAGPRVDRGDAEGVCPGPLLAAAPVPPRPEVAGPSAAGSRPDRPEPAWPAVGVRP